MSTIARSVSWAARIIVAVILFQTLFFKFTGADESRYIFSIVMGPELEAIGRIGSGIAELAAVLLILVPRTAWLGAFVALGTILGAILSHLTLLGIEVQGDGGLLFALAITVFVLSALVLLMHRRELPLIGEAFRESNA